MSATAFYTESNNVARLHSSELDEPGTTCILEYLNEGGANVVFRILPEFEAQELPARLHRKLLRLRKDLSHVQSAADQLAAYEQSFQGLFDPSLLVQHELIQIDDGIAQLLNDVLKKLVRPAHRVQDFLPDSERHGLLVTDMTPRAGELLVQIKPKWLTQSPNAPAEAKRCRTCALRAQRASAAIRTATDAQESCPLELISDALEDRQKSAHAVTDPRLHEYLITEAQPLLQRLRECQMSLDGKGILNTSDSASIFNLCKAMTLRDCTLFLKRSGDSVEARLADLDLKQPEKLMRWKKVEQDLIKGGWYTNSEHQASWTREKTCLLARDASSWALR